jgi:hypothetical protein
MSSFSVSAVSSVIIAEVLHVINPHSLLLYYYHINNIFWTLMVQQREYTYFLNVKPV